MSASSPIIVALDFDNAKQAVDLARQLSPDACRVKVGKTLFTSAGRQVVEKLQALGFEVFLDLKFHDIANTVAGAIRASAELGVWLVNVHALGGRAMLEAAAQALANYQNRPLLIGVTILTSMSEQDLAEIGMAQGLPETVARLAQLTKTCGLDGVVCSAKEAGAIKTLCGQEFITVTPAIRPLDWAKDDQVRTLSPKQAIASGSDYLVVGRPITQAQDPALALHHLLEEIQYGR